MSSPGGTSGDVRCGWRKSKSAELLRVRLNAGLRQIAFFVIPAVAAFLVLGDVIVSAIYQSGRFELVRLGNSGRIDGGFARVHARRLYRPRITPEKIRARRFATPSCVSSLRPCLDISQPFRCRINWDRIPLGCRWTHDFTAGFFLVEFRCSPHFESSNWRDGPSS